jgi:hypothetical protein
MYRMNRQQKRCADTYFRLFYVVHVDVKSREFETKLNSYFSKPDMGGVFCTIKKSFFFFFLHHYSIRRDDNNVHVLENTVAFDLKSPK